MAKGLKITESDFPKIEKKMRQLIDLSLLMERVELPIGVAKQVFAHNPYKQEFLAEIEALGHVSVHEEAPDPNEKIAFKKQYLKPEVIVMGETKSLDEARYIHGDFGKGTWTFYGGHDPEDYEHRVGDPPTDLNLFPNSPGYRLILNNVLFPAAKKKKQKT